MGKERHFGGFEVFWLERNTLWWIMYSKFLVGKKVFLGG